MHTRSRHPDSYHADNVPKQRVKERWTDEMLHLVAREEARLISLGMSDRINQRLVAVFPRYTIEQLKGARNKNPKYKRILAELLKADRGDDDRWVARASCGSSMDQASDRPEGAIQGQSDNPPWAQAVKAAISEDHLHCPIDWEKVNPGNPDEQSKEMIDREFAEWIASLQIVPKQRNAARRQRQGANLTGRRLRRHQYARVQGLYKRNRGRCAKEVLSGDWRKANTSSVPLAAMEPAWRDIMEKPSMVDERSPQAVGPVLWQLLAPVTAEEVKQMFCKSSKSAPGPDNISLERLKRIPVEVLVSHFNLWQYASYQPDPMRIGRTIFIEKVAGTNDPLCYRPITIASYLIRSYHKILGFRLESTLPWHRRQKGFMQGDGIAQNVWMLETIINEAKAKLKPLCLTFVDVKKAFDSVSHDTILVAARRMGVPDPFINYLREFYKDSRTVFEVSGERSEMVRTTRGVKQGDPLSAYLFNAVVDMALGSLDTGIGVEVGEIKLNTLAYADDVVLLARTPEGLQSQLTAFTENLALGGLRISAGVDGKSASLRIDVDGKAKKWIANPHSFLKAGDQCIPAMSATKEYKYLGIAVSALGNNSRVKAQLDRGLKELTEAPLKPQQRLWFLRQNLLPQLYHQLVITGPTDKLLKWLDTCVRSAVRSWLRLPKDTPIPFFHANDKDGGLSIQSLRFQVPLMRRKRLGKLDNSDDPAVRALVGTARMKSVSEKADKPLKLRGTIVTSGTAVRLCWRDLLIATVDGRGLANHQDVDKIHKWVSDGSSLMSGKEFIGCVQVRAGTLPTAVRSSRGRPNVSASCDCCGRPEFLGHILQVCPRTWGERIKRHDNLCNYLSGKLQKKGFKVIQEPCIATDVGIRKPDLVISRDGEATIVDMTVVADNASLNDAHMRKCRYYNDPKIIEWVKTHTGCSSVAFGAVSMNWRGAMAPRSYSMLKDTFGLSLNVVRLMSVKTVIGGFYIYCCFKRSTFRTRSV